MLRQQGDFDLEMDMESSTEGLVLIDRPLDGSVRQLADRARRRAPIASVLLAFAGVAMICATQDPRRVSQDVARKVGLALGAYSSKGETTLMSQGMEGQPFVYVGDVSKFKVGDAVIFDVGSENEEIHRAEELYNDTGCIRLYHGLEFDHSEDTSVQAAEYTPELQEKHERQASTEYARFSKAMQFGASTDDTYVRMNRGCFQFEPGDEVELADRKTGQYEYNMVTGVSLDNGKDMSVITCSFHLAYPVAYHHDAIAEPWPEISKMAGVRVGSAPAEATTTAGVASFDITTLDTNEDGKVSRAEALLAAAKSFSAAEMAARFRDVDKDGNGFLDAAEMSGYDTLDTDGGGSITKKEAAGNAYVNGKFRDWDRDRDGKLSQEEFFLAAKGIRTWDTDGDGKVSKAEVLASDSKEFVAAEVAARFADLDKDQDGYLGEGEVSGYETLDSNGDNSIAKIEAVDDPYVKGKFAKWDEDGDDKLSREELFSVAGGPDIATLDINGDGNISKKEALTGGKASAWAAEVAARFVGLDQDRDGSLNTSEASSFKPLDSNSDGSISMTEAVHDAYVEGKFADWDRNGDGKLSKQELLSAAQGEPDLRSLDADGDGMASKAEVLGGALESAWAAELAARFNDTDKDQDGSLSSEEIAGYRSLDSDGDGFITKEESESNPVVQGRFADWDRNGDGRLSHGELEEAALDARDISGLDTDKDDKISKKEAWVEGYKKPWAAEVAALFSDTDKDNDGSLSRSEIAGYETLDDNNDGLIDVAEGAHSAYLKGKFVKWDGNSDGKLDQHELLKAAMGEPQIVFIVKSIDFPRFSHDDAELFETKRQESEETIASALGNVDKSQVLVKLSDGSQRSANPARKLAALGSTPSAERRSLQAPASHSVRVDAWIDGDASQVTEKRKNINNNLRKLYVEDAAMEPFIQGDKQKLTVASIQNPRDKNTGAGLNLPVLLGIVVCSVVAAAVALFYLRGGDNDDKGSGATKLKSRWAEHPPQAIVVPGGGLSKDGTLVPWVQERLNKAKKIYDEVNEVKKQLAREKQSNNSNNNNNGSIDNNCYNNNNNRYSSALSTSIVTMCEGIRYSPRDPRGNRTLRLESQLSAEYLRSLGVAAEDLITDDLSLDTMGNAYFLRTTHTDVFKARSLVVVTNEFHMSRTRTIFDRMFTLGPFPAGCEEYSLAYETVPNHSVEPKALQRRVEWEKQQMQEFTTWSKQWKDLHDVHAHIFSGEEDSAVTSAGGARKSLPSSFTRMRLDGSDPAVTPGGGGSSSKAGGSSSTLAGGS